MAYETINCYKCQERHYKPGTIPFKLNCYRCGTVIGSENGKDLWYDLSNHNPNWQNKDSPPKQLSDRNESYTGLIVTLSIVLLIIIVGSIGHYYSPKHQIQNTLPYPNLDSSLIDTQTTHSSLKAKDFATLDKNETQTKEVNGLSIYSGTCTYSKKKLNGNLMTLKPISRGFAKVVINRKDKKIYFYYNRKLVFMYFGYSSYIDDREGGEGFTFDSDADAHRYNAERVFILNTEMIMGGQLGYQYEVTNYSED